MTTQVMTIEDIDDRAMTRLSSLTGKERDMAIEYYTLAIAGAYGTISMAGCAYCRRCLEALSQKS